MSLRCLRRRSRSMRDERLAGQSRQVGRNLDVVELDINGACELCVGRDVVGDVAQVFEEEVEIDARWAVDFVVWIGETERDFSGSSGTAAAGADTKDGKASVGSDVGCFERKAAAEVGVLKE